MIMEQDSDLLDMIISLDCNKSNHLLWFRPTMRRIMDTLGSTFFYTQTVQVWQSNRNWSFWALSSKKAQAPKRKKQSQAYGTMEEQTILLSGLAKGLLLHEEIKVDF